MSKNIELKLNAKMVAYELFCIKCRNAKFEEKEDSSKDTITSTFENMVFEDNKCDKCGCNTFDVDCFIKLDVQVPKEPVPPPTRIVTEGKLL